MRAAAGYGFGAIDGSLAELQKNVDRCLRAFPLDNSSNAAADMSVTCDLEVGGASGGSGGFPLIEKTSFVDQADNVVVFNLARTLLTGWRNTSMGSRVSATEANVRRVAAQKLGEEPVLTGGPVVQAAQTLSSAGRIESDRNVRLAIIRSLSYLLRTRNESIIPSSVRTEALTTLKIFADPNVQSDPYVLNAANDALKALGPKIVIGPITVEPVPQPRSKWTVPLIAMGVTAALATGGLIWYFRRPAAHAVGMGRLRRKVELSRYRRKS